MNPTHSIQGEQNVQVNKLLLPKNQEVIQNSLLTIFVPYIHRYNNELLLMAAFFICYGLHSIKCESTDFTNLNDLIPKASFSIFRFIFWSFERSDGIFYQNLCIWKWIQMWNSHFGSIFRLWNWFVNLGLKVAKKLSHGYDF